MCMSKSLLLMNTTDTYFTLVPFENQFLGVAMFLVLILHLFGHVARPSCNFTLRVMKHLITMFFTTVDGGQLSPGHEKIVKQFPTDLRQVRQKFNIDPVVTIFA